MALPHKQFNLKADYVASALVRYQETHVEAPKRFVVKVVAHKREKAWLNAITVIRPELQDRSSGEDEITQEYEEFQFLRQSMSTDDVTKLIGTMSAGSFSLNGVEISVEGGVSQWCLQELSTNNHFWSRPVKLFETQGSSIHGFGDIGLLDFNLPYWDSVFRAISKWIEISPFHHSDSRLGHIFVVVPEQRAFFHDMRVKGDEVDVTFDGPSIAVEELKVKGAFVAKESYYQVDEIISSKKMILSKPKGATVVELWILGRDGYRYDHYMEPYSDYAYETSFNILQTPKVDNLASTILNAIRSGEGLTVEWKPFVSPKASNDKFDEILRTVIAFLNANGGYVVFGVADDGELVGVTRALYEWAKSEQIAKRNLAQHFFGRVRSRINSEISGKKNIEYHKLEVAGAELLVLTVRKGQETPYHMLKDRQIYIRRNASNMKADPVVDLPRLVQRSSSITEIVSDQEI